METDQKKKIFMMAGALGALLIGFVVIFFGFLNKGENGATPPNGTPPPVSSSPTQNPTMPGPSGSTQASLPTTDPAATPMPGASTLAPGMVNITAITDPFQGGKPSTYEPPVESGGGGTPGAPPQSRTTPVYTLPSINSLSDSPAPANNGGGNLDDNNWLDDDNLWGQTNVTQTKKDAASRIGRNAGWIANDSQGRITAYFELPDGTLRAVGVGSVIDGLRVKSIDKQSLILVDDKTGREERITLLPSGQ